MKKIISMLSFTLFATVANSQVLKSINIYYYDDQTVKGKKIYRELNTIGENPWSKPEKLDIVLSFNKHVNADEDRVEILIEELYEPTNLLKKAPNELDKKRWVPHQVVFSDISKLIKENKLVIKNYAYQTAYFTDSMLFTKDGFRIIGIFYNKSANKIETLMKTFTYGE